MKIRAHSALRYSKSTSIKDYEKKDICKSQESVLEKITSSIQLKVLNDFTAVCLI